MAFITLHRHGHRVTGKRDAATDAGCHYHDGLYSRVPTFLENSRKSDSPGKLLEI